MAERSPSIVWRILRLHFVALLLTAIVLPLAANELLSLDAQSLQRQALDGRAAALTGSLVRSSGIFGATLPAKDFSAYEQGSGGFVFVVLNGQGSALLAEPSAVGAAFADAPRGEGPVYFSKVVGRSTYTAVSGPVERAGAKVWVVVAQDLQNPDVIIDDVVGRFLFRIALVTTPLLVVLMTLDVIGLRRVFRPVLNASKIASSIGPGQGRTLPVEGLPREVLPLAVSMNEAMDRLQAGYAAQRAFNADVAHELRTPLAVLHLRAEGLEDPAERKAVLDAVAAMSRTVGQLLEMAQLDTDLSEAPQTCDLVEVVRNVITALAPYAVEAGRELGFAYDQEPVVVRGDGEFIAVAVRNLIENAIVHAVQAKVIEVCVTPSGEVLVEDDGGGLAEEYWPRAFDRFWKGPDSTGAGIGLAIAHRIVTAFGGTLEVSSSPLGGARFAARFVAADRLESPDHVGAGLA